MRVSDFDFQLPTELIAQTPLLFRDQSRLLVLRRDDSSITHETFQCVRNYLQPNDLLILNDSRVIPARLRGFKPESGGQIEILLCEENAPNDWWVMLRPGKRVRHGTRVAFRSRNNPSWQVAATILDKNSEGHCRLQFNCDANILDLLEEFGEIPLPPYIDRPTPASSINDRERYQTVFAKAAGSVAAPTAGLHFTDELLAELRKSGVRTEYVTLHVGLGTFAPIKAEQVEEHIMHEERFSLPAQTAQAIQETKVKGGRIVAVGTTTVRVLESVAATHGSEIRATTGRTRIFIYPPYAFRVVDALITNFHLPQSTLLMLVSAFASPGAMNGREMILSAYSEAVMNRYRFFSYGDAMLIF